MNRWPEYNDGELHPGDIVQQDVIRGETLYWVLTSAGIVGPMSRQGKHDLTEVVEAALALSKEQAATIAVEAEDGVVV